eukprot:6191493-Pleurochrysis_carterae.AAC.2
MTNGVVGSASRPGATTAAIWRRRLRMRSAIVPSSFLRLSSALPHLSPLYGGDGAMSSCLFMSPLSMLLSSPYMANVKIACASASLRIFANRSMKAASVATSDECHEHEKNDAH